ncbi:MAG: tRNA (pseudouridine(54)-N(1))-methyltransferase TrmY [Candidatus Aenigmatarchaeota archaeon]
MRVFVLRSLKGLTREFEIDEIRKSRMDIVANCALNALMMSNQIRKDTKFIACLDGPPKPPATIIFDGNELKEVYPSEIGFLEVISKALKILKHLKFLECKEAHYGVYICRKAWEHVVKELAENFQLIYLDPEGKNWDEVEFKENVAFFLGDHIGLPKKSIKFLERFKVEKVSIGKITYFASQAITIVNYLLDLHF